MQQQPSPPYSPSQIKEKLLQALDHDCHVVDMALALEAVSLLEKTTVTKEALETTRLGRIVNEMRKKTKNDILARRAKDLVRRWRDMVSKPSENGTGGTGQGPGMQGASLVNHLRVAGVKSSVSSPALCEMGRTASPGLPRPIHNLAISPTSPAFRGVTLSPALQRKTNHSTGSFQQQQQRVISPSNSVASNTSTSPGLSFFTHSNSSRPSTPSSLVVKSKAISPGPGRPVIESSSDFSTKTNHHRGLKRTRDNDEETMTGFELSGKRSRGSNGVDWPWIDECSRDSNLSWSGDSLRMTNHSALGGGEDRSVSSSSKTSRPPRGRSKVEPIVKPEPTSNDVLREKFASIARVSKVKTTQELLEDLARRSGSPNLAARPEVQSIHLQQNNNHQQGSTAPSEARQWPDAKQELLDKFFRSHSNDRRSDGVAANTTTGSVASKPLPAVNDPVAEIYARLPPLDPSVVATLWTEEDYPQDNDESNAKPTTCRPVTDEDVDLLHNEPVDGVSGSRDIRDDFHQWHETLSVASYHGDPLHLLPYVVIE